MKQGITDKAIEVNNLFYVILWLALPVFVFVEGMLLLSILRFRKRRGDDTLPPQTPGGRGALTAFFAGPLAIVIVLLLFGETAVSRVDRDDSHPAEQLVLTGFQWEWSARYVNEHVIVTGKTNKTPLTMELPVDVTTHVELRSTDVMHEFYVPDLLFMKNAIPGHPNTFTITPTDDWHLSRPVRTVLRPLSLQDDPHGEGRSAAGVSTLGGPGSRAESAGQRQLLTVGVIGHAGGRARSRGTRTASPSPRVRRSNSRSTTRTPASHTTSPCTRTPTWTSGSI